MQEQNPTSAHRRCVDLSAVASTVHELSEKAKTPDHLCDICSNIDLTEFFLDNPCYTCRNIDLANSSSADYDDNMLLRYHIGKVEDILSRKGCALCRMISTIHSSAGFHALDLPSEECILIASPSCDEIQVRFTTGRFTWDIKNTAVVHSIRQCVEDSMVNSWMNEEFLDVPIASVTNLSKKPRRIGGRRMQQQLDFDLIRNWLHLCETSHGDKCSPSGLLSKTACNIRLIDVLNLQVIDGTTNGRYLALSYVWGTGQQFRLSSQNVKNLQSPHGIKIDSISRTIRDAIKLVANIGERYLWVDQLCILADDERDKLEQISNMDQIYNSATLTIINGDALCSHAPIAGIEPETRNLLQHSEVIRGARYITTQPDLMPKMSYTKWSTRGWTYQEGFLSSRCLVFTDYQAYFQCKSDTWCEDSYSTGSRLKEEVSTTGNMLCYLPDFCGKFIGERRSGFHGGYHVDPNVSSIQRCSLYEYMDSIEAFSRRQLTLETDALLAFTGIMKAFQTHFLMGSAWGLPVEKLDATLHWHPSRYLDGTRKGFHSVMVDSHVVLLPFPTWSWASWGGGVVFVVKCEEEIKGLVEWHQPFRYAIDPAEPFSKPWYRVTAYNTLNPIYDDSLNSSSYVIMDEMALGFLRFTTSSVLLNIEAMDLNNTEASRSEGNTVSEDWVSCYIRTHTGKDIGAIKVPTLWLEGRSHKEGECILLSTHINYVKSEIRPQVLARNELALKGVSETEHSDDGGFENQSIYNVLLIEWKEGRHCPVANRISITQILKKDWEELESRSKLIVLG